MRADLFILSCMFSFNKGFRKSCSQYSGQTCLILHADKVKWVASRGMYYIKDPHNMAYDMKGIKDNPNSSPSLYEKNSR